MLKEILLTHTDMDGISCAILLKDEMDIIKYIDYSDLKDDNFHKIINFLEDQVYKREKINLTISDLSLTVEQIRYLSNMSIISHIKIYDHHQATEKLFKIDNSKLTIVYDNEICATRIIAREMNHLNRLSEIVDAGDLFKTDSLYFTIGTSIGTLVKNEKVRYIKKKDYDYEFIANVLETLFKRLDNHFLLSYINIEIEWAEARQSVIGEDKNVLHSMAKETATEMLSLNNNNKLLFISDLENYNLVCFYIFTQNINIDCIVHINTQHKTIAFRSHDRSDFNTAKLANEFGGGGHKNASGCMMKDGDVDTFKQSILAHYNKLKGVKC